jgi:hypothetical protein
MKKYKSEKTTKIVRRLEAMQRLGDETLAQVAEVIKGQVEFYDGCLASWDRPAEKFSLEEIELGRKCCHAGLDMAEGIVNELRILYLKEGEQ